MKLVGKKKGTLAGGKGQTPEMYYIGSDNDIGKDSNGNIATTNMSLTVSNVATHLSIMTELYKNSRVSAEGQKVVGDEERIAEQKAINSIQTMLSGLIDGENVEFTKNMGAETVTAVSAAAGAAALSGTGIAISNHLGSYTLKGGIKTISKEVTKVTKKTLIRKVAQQGGKKTLQKTLPTYTKCITSASSKAAVGLGVAGVIAGGVAGGFAGAAVADAIIDGSKEDFTDENGNFMEDKAGAFKGWSVTSGVGLGAGATALLTFGLTNPVGWVCLGLGAVAGLVAWGIKSWWK